MIISEKQIMQLMDMARAYMHVLIELHNQNVTFSDHATLEKISTLLRAIREQQSEELKVVE